MTTKIDHETGLREEVVDALANIFLATREIDEVVVFGSRAKGNFSDGSDIDLAIKGKGINIDTILNLMANIDELLCRGIDSMQDLLGN